MRKRGLTLQAVVRACLIALLGLCAGGPVSAAAKPSGSPIKLATPGPIGRASLAVSSSGTAYVAWPVRKDLVHKDDLIQYCVLRRGSKRCKYLGKLTLANSASYVESLTVLIDHSRVLIVADVYRGTGPITEDYYPVQEWQSTDGGRRFTIVNHGLSVVSGGGYDSNQIPLNAVVMPGGTALGYGWLNPTRPPTFAVVPLSGSAECSQSLSRPLCPFATLGPIANNIPPAIQPGQVAARLSGTPGVLVLYVTQFESGPLACYSHSSAYFGTAFAYGSGVQSITNDYNASPGSPHSAWKVTLAPIECKVEDATVGGGPVGLGIIEYNEGNGLTVYRQFDQQRMKFDTAVTIAKYNALGSKLGGEVFPSLSQDSRGGIYATYQLGSDQTAALSYSRDGGKQWRGPISINDGSQREVYLSSAVSPRGQGWAVWFYQRSVYARTFDKSGVR